MSFRDDFLHDMNARGLIHQCSNIDQLDEFLQTKPRSAYIGFDCTAPSLHVGNLMTIMTLRRWQQAGHKPIIVMGGGTTRIGDPSGKDTQRILISEEKIEKNIASLRQTFARFLRFGDNATDAIIVNNHDWLKDLNYIDFLRDIGRHFSVNRMLTMDSVQLRLERQQPLSFIEFNYMVVQAYDFLHLYEKYGCQLQMGGSDQWGNIINGVELARRKIGAELFALTMPLITTSAGIKMGKTAEGAVWLNAASPDEKYACSPYAYWQFWRNTQDSDVARFLNIFTELPIDEIKRLEKLQGEDLNEAKKILADSATILAHGDDAASKAARAAKMLFEDKNLSADMPAIYIKSDQLGQTLGLLEAYVMTGLAASHSEARRYIKAGAARVNNAVITDEKKRLTHDDLSREKTIALSIGKKNHRLIRIK